MGNKPEDEAGGGQAGRPDPPAPSVSVILPAFNAEAYLAEALESVLAQSFTDFELLLHDDGSSDATLRIAQGFEARVSVLRAAKLNRAGFAGGLFSLAMRPWVQFPERHRSWLRLLPAGCSRSARAGGGC